MQHDGVLCAASRIIRVQATPDHAGKQSAFSPDTNRIFIFRGQIRGN